MTNKQLIRRILADPRATRRDFMVGATALGLTATVASGLWSSRALAATPQRGGHLRAGMIGGNTSDSIDPTTYIDTVMIGIGRAIRDSLVEVGQDNSVQPGLAESWEASADAKTWRFKLRKGVTFASGKSVTPEDVVNSVNAHRGEESKSGAKGVFEPITDVSAEGTDTVVFTLSGGNADFPYLLTDYHMYVVPTVDGKPDLAGGDGTGLYVIKEFEPGVKCVLERNPNAWQSDLFGYVDSAEIIVLSDGTARQNALLTDEVDCINRPDLKTVGLLKRRPNVRIQDVTSNLMYTMPMHVNTDPFTSNDLRLALKYAIDREEFVQKILYGYGAVGNDQPIGPGFNYHNADLKPKEPDLDKAKYHVKKAGMEGVTIDYSASDTAYVGAVGAGELFAESCAKAGININVVREPNDGYWSNVWNKKPFCACYWGSRPVEDMILSICYTSTAAWNDTRINIPRVDELVTAARAELDPAKRAEQYGEVQSLISEDGGTIIPAFGKDVAVLSDKVGTSDQIGGGWEMDGGHFIKRWWKTG